MNSLAAMEEADGGSDLDLPLFVTSSTEKSTTVSGEEMRPGSYIDGPRTRGQRMDSWVLLFAGLDHWIMQSFRQMRAHVNLSFYDVICLAQWWQHRRVC